MTTQGFPEPSVDPKEYRSGFCLVYVACSVPLLFLGIDLWRRAPDWFAPSGAIALFLVAFVQARQFSRMHVKHFRNAERAAKKLEEPIQGPSRISQALEKRAFWVGLYGTAIWAYGDKIVKLLVH